MMKHLSLSKAVWRQPEYFIAFGFGSGLMPIAPGTWGTCAALPLYLLCMHLSSFTYFFCTVIAFALGVYVCHRVSSELGEHDYGGIVWDEIVGYLMTMFLVPIGLGWMVLGFCLFRLFDIWKPFPIRWVDKRVQGGLGIMLDDALAALPAWLILQILAKIYS